MDGVHSHDPRRVERLVAARRLRHGAGVGVAARGRQPPERARGGRRGALERAGGVVGDGGGVGMQEQEDLPVREQDGVGGPCGGLPDGGEAERQAARQLVLRGRVDEDARGVAGEEEERADRRGRG
ncbi:Os06g0727950 [Oryza sativa Japonica Group]|uniref:Os06g0727950 protein n=1 Tax=Oryza sativa subsp. japonica TaxID=39947 RepID=A0A0P0X1K6_ORYSJ|nr:Os06g0727950 [Oryza sativa Japonica Group]